MNTMSSADDEFLSSYLDGEATPEGVARIESDPTLLARVEELRAARDLVATPVAPLPAADIDAVIGAALDAGTTSPVVTGIERVRRRRSERTRTMVAIAAGVLLLAIAVPVISTISSDSDSDDTAAVEMDGADSGDDSAADDIDEGFSMEALPAAEASDAAAPADDMDTADADVDNTTSTDDTMSTDDSDGAEDPAGTTSAGQTGLRSLQPVLDEAELENAILERLDDYDPALVFEFTGSADLFDQSPVACAEEFAGITPTAELALVDSGVTTVGGTATVVVLVLQADTDEFLLYATPLATCAPIEILELDG